MKKHYVLAGLLLVLTGCDFSLSAKEQKTSCYQVVFSPHVRKDTYLVDTCTSKTWVLVQTSAEGMAWEPMPVIPQPE